MVFFGSTANEIFDLGSIVNSTGIDACWKYYCCSTTAITGTIK
jgi:hypothetical protein